MYSTAGFGFLLNLPGDGSVAVNSSGAIDWDVVAQKQLDFWITTTPAAAAGAAAAPVYKQYADAVGHAPPLPGYAALFWQCRLRYRTQQILEDIALGYHQRNLSLGVIVVDFMNQKRDGDFHMNPVCFPNISSMTARVKSLTGAQTMVSFWPDVKPDGDAAATLSAEGCINSGTIDPTSQKCRDLIWSKYIQPNYVDQGVTDYWLDEDDMHSMAPILPGETERAPSQAYLLRTIHYCKPPEVLRISLTGILTGSENGTI